VAGSATPQARAVGDVIEALGGTAVASVVGTARRTSPTQAALANGTAAHALDFDDTNHPLYGHPTCHLWPALLAIAEGRGSTGAEVLAAYLIGFEVEVRVARAVNLAHYVAGWHATATLGTLGATGAVARLLHLTPVVTAHALGIAASLTGGLRENFGTDTKPLHAGLAAERGVQAALLAQAGLTASATALSGRYGFCAVLGGGEEPRLEELDPDRFGRPWEISEPYGLAIKQFPSCGATHPAIEAAIEAAGGTLDPGEVAKIRVGTTELAPRVLVHPRPRTGLEGKFSLEYCVAIALLDGRVGLDHFEDAAVDRAEVRALLPRIEPYVEDSIRSHPEYAAKVEIELADGTRREALVEVARGKVARPLEQAELLAKYRNCTSRVLAADQLEAGLVLIRTLPEQPSLTPLVAALVHTC
jgi:2-methylcitrate dehydratase PrpD